MERVRAVLIRRVTAARNENQIAGFAPRHQDRPRTSPNTSWLESIHDGFSFFALRARLTSNYHYYAPMGSGFACICFSPLFPPFNVSGKRDFIVCKPKGQMGRAVVNVITRGLSRLCMRVSSTARPISFREHQFKILITRGILSLDKPVAYLFICLLEPPFLHLRFLGECLLATIFLL